MLRISVILCSLAAAIGLTTLDDGQPRIISVLAGIGALVAALVFVIVAYGTLSDLRHNSNGDAARILCEFYPAGPDAKLSFILLPGMLNRGDVVYQQYVDPFKFYGDVLVVNWPRNGFDGQAIAKRIFHLMAEHNMTNPVFVGQSLGSLVAMDVMNYYVEQGSPLGPIQGFIGDSAFTGIRDAKLPAPAWVASLIRDLPFQSLYWPAFAKYQSRSGVARMDQLTEPRVPAWLLALHHYEMNHVSFHAVAAQGRYIAQFTPPSGVLEAVPAIFLQTPNVTDPATGKSSGDVLLHEDQALRNLQRLFPRNEFADVGGIHANAVERPFEHWTYYRHFVEKCLVALP